MQSAGCTLQTKTRKWRECSTNPSHPFLRMGRPGGSSDCITRSVFFRFSQKSASAASLFFSAQSFAVHFEKQMHNRFMVQEYGILLPSFTPLPQEAFENTEKSVSPLENSVHHPLPVGKRFSISIFRIFPDTVSGRSPIHVL